LLHLCHEVEDVAAATTAETVEALFGEADAKLRRIGSFVDRTRAAETFSVPAPLELFEQTVTLKHLLHRDGCFYCFEVNIIGVWHRIFLSTYIENLPRANARGFLLLWIIIPCQTPFNRPATALVKQRFSRLGQSAT